MTSQQPVFVLVRPQMGENIGAAARAMWNFGLDRLRIVDPRDGWPNPKAVAMASGAGRLLDHAGIFAATDLAVAECSYVLATTARTRGLTKAVLTPEQAMSEARRRLATGEKVAVLFGPERTGMENDDIARASAVVSVPVNPRFASLNLAQCVLLLAYEWRRASEPEVPARMEMAGSDWASRVEVERLGDRYEECLELTEFFFPPQKAAGMKLKLRNMWGRLALTRADVQILHGMLRHLLRHRGSTD